MWSKNDFGNAWFMWLAPAFHQAPRPLVAERHARSSLNPRFISVLARVKGCLHWRHSRPLNLRLIDKVGIEQVVADLRARGEI